MAEELNWDQVVEDLGPRLYSYMKRRAGDSFASDLTQEALVRLFEKVEDGHFDPNKGSLAQYAFGLARFVFLESRTVSKDQELEDDFQSNILNQEDVVRENQKFLLVRRAISQLSAVQQDVINLILDEELKLEEIGHLLQMPVGTVKSHVARAKEKMKEQLKDHWENL